MTPADVLDDILDWELGRIARFGPDVVFRWWRKEMPLKKGSSKAVVSKNIKEMVKAGHPQKVAVAAALRQARESQKK